MANLEVNFPASISIGEILPVPMSLKLALINEGEVRRWSIVLSLGFGKMTQTRSEGILAFPMTIGGCIFLLLNPASIVLMK